jgi:hypothetical protein
MTAQNWTTLFREYKGLWVALKDDEITVISSGDKLSEVIQKAAAKGFHKPIITKVPKKDITYIGALHEPRLNLPL